MIVNPIRDGIVLDHITAGKAMEIYRILDLDKLGCTVAIIKNADSVKMGKKDILKICEVIDIDLDVIGYIDPGITVNIIRDGVKVSRFHLELPETVTNVIRCSNPRCITSIEQGLDHVFVLTDEENQIYRCKYCEEKYRRRR